LDCSSTVVSDLDEDVVVLLVDDPLAPTIPITKITIIAVNTLYLTNQFP